MHPEAVGVRLGRHPAGQGSGEWPGLGRVQPLGGLFLLKHRQSVLGRSLLLELVEHMSLKNPVIKLLRRQANRFP